MPGTVLKIFFQIDISGLVTSRTTCEASFISKFISLACRCLMEGKISRGTFAEYLEIDRAEIDNYLNDAGFLEENYAKIAAA